MVLDKKCRDPNPKACKAAFALIHVTQTASVYLENVWGYVADRGLDDASSKPLNIAAGRGLLLESTSPSWLIGTSFQRCTLYQYNLNRASDVYIGLQQAESPYWQGNGTQQRAPAPWVANSSYGDPSFGLCTSHRYSNDNDRCYRAYGQRLVDSNNVVIHGSALWASYNAMNNNKWHGPNCDETSGVCQMNMVFISGALNISWYSISTKSTRNMMYDAGLDSGLNRRRQSGRRRSKEVGEGR